MTITVHGAGNVLGSIIPVEEASDHSISRTIGPNNHPFAMGRPGPSLRRRGGEANRSRRNESAGDERAFGLEPFSVVALIVIASAIAGSRFY